MTISFSTISSGEPFAITLPEFITYMKSHMSKVALTLWSLIRIPIFFSFKFLIKLLISFMTKGSIPANGSSSKINFGERAIALAISTRLL